VHELALGDVGMLVRGIHAGIGTRLYCTRLDRQYSEELTTNGRQLFWKLLFHFAMGASLGGILSCLLIALNVQHVLAFTAMTRGSGLNEPFTRRFVLIFDAP
jgi:hypothetical protein